MDEGGVMEKFACIGTGMMGNAIVSGIVRNGIIPAENIVLSNATFSKAEALAKKIGASAVASNIEAVKDADIILLAVKPQFLGDVLTEIKGSIDPNALILSVIAGVPIERYQNELDHEYIIRVMPNTPARIGQGMCAWYATDSVTERQKEITIQILSALGEQSEVKRESMLEVVTAVSGSGPAYVYLFMEAMMDAAVLMGMPRPEAEKYVLQTVIGSAEYLKASGAHPAVLRNEVTSPAGTTAEALAVMEREGLRSAVSDGMRACLERAKALGK